MEGEPLEEKPSEASSIQPEPPEPPSEAPPAETPPVEAPPVESPPEEPQAPENPPDDTETAPAQDSPEAAPSDGGDAAEQPQEAAPSEGEPTEPVAPSEGGEEEATAEPQTGDEPAVADEEGKTEASASEADAVEVEKTESGRSIAVVSKASRKSVKSEKKAGSLTSIAASKDIGMGGDMSREVKDNVEIESDFFAADEYDPDAKKLDDAEVDDEPPPPNPTLIYYQNQYEMQLERQKIVRLTNNYLQMKLVKHFGRRIYGPCGPIVVNPQDSYNPKYEHDLIALRDLYQSVIVNNKEHKIELIQLEKKVVQYKIDLNRQFEEMQVMIQDVTNGIANDTTSHFVERFLKRQRYLYNHINKGRLLLIRLRRAHQEKQDAYDDLDHLGPGFHIMDYVQLKIDQKNFRDKVDNREKELNQIRDSYKHIVQVLAHTREKIEMVKKATEECDSDLQTITLDFWNAREQLTYIRNERDTLRKGITKMFDVLGLAAKPLLIEDMSTSSVKVEELTAELNTVEKEVEDLTWKTSKLRAQLELLRGSGVGGSKKPSF